MRLPASALGCEGSFSGEVYASSERDTLSFSHGLYEGFKHRGS